MEASAFGGVIAFLFADLIILPVLNIYRKYYGMKIAALLFVVFYAAMSLAALAVDGIFAALHWIPEHGRALVMEEGIRWNYTSVLNVIFLADYGAYPGAVSAHRRAGDAAHDGCSAAGG